MANATINLPLIPDTLAVRATVFTDRRGGYISNVPGTIAAVANPAPASMPRRPQITHPLVGSNLTRWTTTPCDSRTLEDQRGLELLVQQNYQSMEADGYFSSYPKDRTALRCSPIRSPPLRPQYNKDKYESTSWTLSGKTCLRA